MRRTKCVLGWAVTVFLALGFVACFAFCLWADKERPPLRIFIDPSVLR